ncbi:TIGR02391 family protein [Pseudoalteromonas sp. Isolate3]|uniref:TIGR02391 family protein n=1 Tax=Pseudoalteromonas sp. Isolate3 TaxID=2908526 RepID=UPI001EFDDCF0|nr:TIGR02391 family protein [Pseudoalteromonas sp. Isolate3]MCG9710321.1 TIGR02391 family protein [Pseudoalteromonas sp. Isolate3]
MTKLAGIEYRGTAGISKHCINAVTEMIHFGRMLNTVKILTTGNEYHYNHALLINIDVGIDVAIKSGFTSGYSGEGPRAFSYTLSVLRKFCDEIEEYYVPQKFLEKINSSALTVKDLDWLSEQTPVIPQQWYDYIYEGHTKLHLQQGFPVEIPLSLIDERLLSTAILMKQNPDNALMDGYRLLEKVIKEKSGLTKETGAKLFSKALSGESSPLHWENLDGSETTGRANMFSSIFMAFRNRRAHQQLESEIHNDLREFLLLNQLFILEQSTKIREV